MYKPAKKEYPHDTAQNEKEESGEGAALDQLSEAGNEKTGESGNNIT